MFILTPTVKNCIIIIISEVREKLLYAVSCGKPVLINCIIDKDVNVLPMVPAGASVAEPILEIAVDC